MTKKAKGSAEAATSIPSQVQSPDKGYENMETITTPSAKRPEVPCQKVTRLAKELSAALAEVEGYHMAIVYPTSDHQYPVMICLQQSYAQQMKALYAYRDAWKVFSAAKPRTKARGEAHFALFLAKKELHKTFDEGEAE
ncbi:hypothetical protein [Brucella intermedia]|uniref:hypothetical protein n=1 Tax=Brucella intermedia TaxID=94625 RepID=UPI0024485126|nr:hypothetical protein [Brucella intermedia]WGG58226.1 hypothetical protein QA414_07600 [Brucella intermedia]